MVQVADKESFLMARRLVREEGLFCGGSSGSAVVGALKYALENNLGPDKCVVVLLPDSGYRNLGKVFDDEWMRENRFLDSGMENARAQSVLAAKPGQELVTADHDESLAHVAPKIKPYNFPHRPPTPY